MPHKIVITSTANNGTWLDVDYVVITAAAVDSGCVLPSNPYVSLFKRKQIDVSRRA